MLADLTEWCEHYAKSRDTFERKIVSMVRKGPDVIVTKKDGVLTYVVMPEFSASVASHAGTIVAVCLQTPKNFAALVDNFALLTKKEDLTVIFVNPKVHEKWVVKPAVHHAVADKESLMAGLKALYDTVPEV